MFRFFIILIFLLLTPCFGKEISGRRKWQYRKLSLVEMQEIQKKLVKAEKRAMYVRVERQYRSRRKGCESYVFFLSPELKNDLLGEWRVTKNWATAYKEGTCILPMYLYHLDFLDENKNCIASIATRYLCYQPKGKSNFIFVEDKVFSLFPEIKESKGQKQKKE